jgi:hypothetical protein
MSHSSNLRFWHAWWTATKDEEHADWIVKLGPVRLSLKETRVLKKSLSLLMCEMLAV